MSSEDLNSGNMQDTERERYFFSIMTERQRDRYDNYRAAKIPKVTVEKITQEILGSNAPIDKKISTLIAGLAKDMNLKIIWKMYFNIGIVKASGYNMVLKIEFSH